MNCKGYKDKELVDQQTEIELQQNSAMPAQKDTAYSRDEAGGSLLQQNGSLVFHEEIQFRKRGCVGGLKYLVYKEPLLIFTIVGVIMGIVIGLPLRQAEFSSTVIRILGLPGDIMINLLKMLVLPLIGVSMMLGVCSLRSSSSSADMGAVAKYTVMAYLINMITAVVVGLLVVQTVRPGRDKPFQDYGNQSSGCNQQHQDDIHHHLSKAKGAIDSLLDTILNFFPSNIVVAAVNMNVLGIISFSLIFGAALSGVPQPEPFIAVLKTFSDTIFKMVEWVIWISPVGIFSLILKTILEACSVSGTLEALGLFIVTVLLGLCLFATVVLPIFYWSFTRRNPLKLIPAFSQALVTGFGTDSSAVTLPIIMECAEKFGLDKSIIDFVLPLGTTINMSGTALYEAIAVLFIAQANGVELSFAKIIIVALTATLAAMGAAAVPSAGLVTMIMVLVAVGLDEYVSDIAVIFAIDWFLDRCRTTVNLMGDAICCAVVDTLIKNARQKSLQLQHMT